MKRLILALLVLGTALVGGCVTPQGPIHLDAAYWAHKPDSVGVVIVKLPQPKTMKAGAQGLLDVAINNAMADSLTKHLNSLSLNDFRESGKVIAAHFSRQGVPTKLISEDLDLATLTKVKDAAPGFAKV